MSWVRKVLFSEQDRAPPFPLLYKHAGIALLDSLIGGVSTGQQEPNTTTIFDYDGTDLEQLKIYGIALCPGHLGFLYSSATAPVELVEW